MIKKGKKCICKKCEDCNFNMLWDMENKDGLRRQMDKCLFLILAEEIPRIKGSIDGCQGAVNEARNRSMETKNAVINYGSAAQNVFNEMSEKFIAVMLDINNKLKLIE